MPQGSLQFTVSSGQTVKYKSEAFAYCVRGERAMSDYIVEAPSAQTASVLYKISSHMLVNSNIMILYE